MKPYLNENIPDRKHIYTTFVAPYQNLFRANMKAEIKRQGMTYRGFTRLLEERAGIKMNVTSLIYDHPNQQRTNNMYFFCGVAHLLGVNVFDLFKENYLESI